MKATLITIGIILLVVGIIGIAANYYVTWMWVVLALGVIGVLWGWLAKGNSNGSM